MGAAMVPILTSVATSVAGSIVSSAFKPDAPEPVAPPPPPAPVVTPVAPEPVEPKVTKAAAIPVIDQEAARIRNLKRRKAASQQKLTAAFKEDEEISLTKSLLGE